MHIFDRNQPRRLALAEAIKKAGEQRLCVHIYDISKAEGWSADYSGNITCLASKEECPYIEKIYVVV